jgi:hypothetical protein
VVICGKDKCIEENISSLILLEYGVQIEPKKHAIHVLLKEKNMNLYDLIKSSKRHNLKLAFKDLMVVFENIEKIQNC